MFKHDISVRIYLIGICLIWSLRDCRLQLCTNAPVNPMAGEMLAVSLSAH